MASKGKEYPLSIVVQTVDRTAALRAIDAKLGRFSRRLDSIGRKTAKIGRSMSTNLTLPIVGIGIAGAKAMSDFEQGMSNVSTLIDTNTENLDEMGKSVLSIGRRTPVALEELTESLYSIRSAGIAANDQFSVLEKSARLGVAGLGTAAEATDLVTSSLNAFQLKGAEAEQVYDNIFKAVKNGKTNIAELAQGFGAVAGTVAATGTPLDEYLASVAALTTTGLPAAQAHSQLRGVMTALTKDTKHTSKVFKSLGAKDFKDLIAQSGGLVPALSRITDELDGNEAKILKVVGRTEAMAAIIGITGGQNKAFVDTLKDMREGANAVDVAFTKQNKSTQAQWKRTKNSLTSAAISIGNVLAPALEGLAEKLQTAAGWFDGLDDGTKEWIVTIAGVVAVAGPALLVFGKLATAISIVTKAVRVMSLAMAANPIMALAVVIGLAAVEIYRNWEDFEAFFKLLWDGVKAIFKDAWDYIQPIVRQIEEAVQTARDAKAYLSGEDTSTDKFNQATRNAEILYAFEQKKYDPYSDASLASERESDAEFDALLASQRAGGVSKIEVDIKGAPPGTRVRTDSTERAIDVKTDYQMAGE